MSQQKTKCDSPEFCYSKVVFFCSPEDSAIGLTEISSPCWDISAPFSFKRRTESNTDILIQGSVSVLLYIIFYRFFSA